MQPILYLMQKEFRQIFRDKMMLRIIFFMPLMQLFIFGYAVNTDLRHVRVSILDEDRSHTSRLLAQSFFTSDLFVPGPQPHDPGDLETDLLDGKTDLTLWIPRNFERNIVAGGSSQVGIAVDGKNSSLAGRSAGDASAIILRENERIRDAMLRSRPQLASRLNEVHAVSRFFYNPEMESRYYMIPGIVVMIITVISGMLTGMAVVREKEIGTLEQLMVTPITPVQLVAGKTIPFVLISFFELIFASSIAVLYFKLPLVGSIPLLLFASLLFLLVTLGGGLLASTVSRTQQQAMFTVWFFLVFGVLTSGFFFPIENMPRVVQVMTYINPMRYFMTVVRGIFLRGVAFQDILGDLVPLALIGILTFSAAVARFRKRLT